MADTYFNFPVPLMQASPNIKKFCNDVIDYCIYRHSLSLNGSNAIKDAAHYFGVTLGNISKTARNGEQLYDSLPLNSAMTGINSNLLFEFYQEYKSDHEIAVLMAFLAIKSILGKKSYTRITTDFLLCRMAGFVSKKELTELPDYLKTYCKRRSMNNIKLDLQKSYGLKIYGRYTRGFFVSFKLTFEELIKEVEMKRKRYYEKQIKDQQSEAVKKVLGNLYGNLNTD